jgi:hypothetical protein
MGWIESVLAIREAPSPQESINQPQWRGISESLLPLGGKPLYIQQNLIAKPRKSTAKDTVKKNR